MGSSRYYCQSVKKGHSHEGLTAGDYVASNAQQMTDKRHKEKAKQVLFSDAFKAHAVEKLIVDKWSLNLIWVMATNSGECPISCE